jgi:hypothetical protein
MPIPFPSHKKNKLTQAHINKNKTKPRPRGNKRSRVDILKIKSDIYSLLDNHTDYQVMDILKMNNQTFYRLKGELYQEAKEIWSQTYKESQELRALHIIDSLNLALKISKEIALDDKKQPKDRLEALNFMIESEHGFLKLINELADDKVPTETERPSAVRPTTYPTVVDPNDPDKWITDPAWVEENMRKMKGKTRAELVEDNE